MLPNREGQRIPSVSFQIREGDAWRSVNSDELFTAKTVVLFALPGAFTPTCSSSHLPRYNELAAAFKTNGVDEIICLSVNDTFVMNAWKQDQEADNITLIPDGNGEFSEGMEMLVDKRDLGFGKRSWRYSMLVKDGVIEKMFIEDDVPGDPFDVSDADTMLDYINPQAVKPHAISLLTRIGCPHCERAKALLRERNMAYEEIVLDRKVTSKTLRAISNADSVPQVFVDGKLIGGADELQASIDQL